MIENNHHHPVLIGTNLHSSQISIFRQNREGWGTRETRCRCAAPVAALRVNKQRPYEKRGLA